MDLPVLENVDLRATGFWSEVDNPIASIDTAFDPDTEPFEAPREKLNQIPVERRKFNFNEVEMPWSENVATRQAKRCLRCDYGKRGMVTTIDNINATHK